MWPFNTSEKIPPYSEYSEGDETNIGNVLKDMGLVSDAQLKIAALQHSASASRIGSTMIELGYITADHLRRGLKIQQDLRTQGREVVGQMAILRTHVEARKVTQNDMHRVMSIHPPAA